MLFHSLSQRPIRKPLQIGLFFTTALLMAVRFSYTTSFLYLECYAYDSAIFQIAEKYRAQGFFPISSCSTIKGRLSFLSMRLVIVFIPTMGLFPCRSSVLLLLFFVCCLLFSGCVASSVSSPPSPYLLQPRPTFL